jgi:hypothetical protein
VARIKDYDKRFWERVDKSGDCWLWTGTVSGRYGMVKYHKQKWKSHRLSWFLHNGEITDGLHVLHKCDIPLCVNPEHLFLGTHQDNMRDMAIKGRRKNKAFGEKHGRAKLTEDQAKEIKTSSLGKRALAKIYGIGATTVQHIRNNQNWRHV